MAKNNRIQVFEELPIPKAVASLSVPTVLAMLVSVIYSLADTYFVGLLNDPVQTAAVSLAGPVLLATNAVNNLFGVGGSSMMSRALGSKDYDTLKASSAFGFYGAITCAVVFSVLCTVFRGPLLGLLGADAATAGYTSDYLNWTITLGAVPTILNVVLSYMVRSEGAALIASVGTMSGCALNVLLDPLFIMPWGLNMGAEGAAAATLLSNCFATLVYLGYLLKNRGKTMVCIDPRALRLNRRIVAGVFGVGLPASIQNLLNVVVTTLLNQTAAPYGAAALAAMGICKKIDMMPMYVALGISQGVMPLLSYNYASKNHKRMRSAFAFTAAISLCISVAAMAVMFFMPGKLVQLFIQDAETVAHGTIILRVSCLMIPFMVTDFLCVGLFQAVGMGKASLILAISRKLALEMPLVLLLDRLAGLYGLPWAQVLAEAGVAAIALFMLMRLFRDLQKQAEQPAAAIPD
ncbi:MAG: MATE family efflux transporter [Faecalibacterium sp.]|nr:MATE family efflux transporter [Faecalibacterium sp.]